MSDQAKAGAHVIEIPTVFLKAALAIAPKADIRTYLNGVLVEVMATETRVVSCNGAALSVFRTPVETPAEAQRKFIIPRDVVEKALKGWKLPNCLVEPADTGKWTINVDTLFAPIDGQFPDYRRVVPAKVTGLADQFDPAIFALFAVVAKALGHKPNDVTLWQSGGEEGKDGASALVSLDGEPNFCGVLMPCRVSKKQMEMPTWANS